MDDSPTNLTDEAAAQGMWVGEIILVKVFYYYVKSLFHCAI